MLKGAAFEQRSYSYFWKFTMLGNLDLQSANCVSEEVRGTYSFGQLPFLCPYVFPFSHTHAHTVQCKINQCDNICKWRKNSLCPFLLHFSLPWGHMRHTQDWILKLCRWSGQNLLALQLWFRSVLVTVLSGASCVRFSKSICLSLPSSSSRTAHWPQGLSVFFRARKRLMLA